MALKGWAKTIIKPILRRLTRGGRAILARYKRRLAVHFYSGARVVYFPTTHPISKAWFYPRYLGGAFHEPQITRLLIQEMNEEDVFFDVGANLGWFTLLGDRICTDGEVHSFELDPKLCSLLLDTLDMNRLSSRHLVSCMAILDEENRFVSFRAQQIGNPSTKQVMPIEEPTGDVKVGGYIFG